MHEESADKVHRTQTHVTMAIAVTTLLHKNNILCISEICGYTKGA
jgi:hypothetical protein